MFQLDEKAIYLLSGIFGLLFISSVTGWMLAKRVTSESAKNTVANLNSRVNAWWAMSAIFLVSMFIGKIANIVLFFLISFFALREFITLTPTKRGDHRTLFLVFFIILPFQYYLVWIDWYGLFSIFIPVYVFLFIPIRTVLANDYENFLERVGKVQWGIMICVYCVSYAPALLTLKIPGYEGNAKLLLFLVIVVQMSDVFQYVWGKLFGRTKLAPNISPNKTWEGAIGGILTAVMIGMGLSWITPFNFWQAGCIALTITLMGLFGGLTMSAIKRDHGIKDFGNLIPGHGGMLDRMDSICFSAPILFHVTRYFFV